MLAWADTGIRWRTGDAVRLGVAGPGGATIDWIGFTSDPNDDDRVGFDDTYAIGDVIELTARFSEAVTITNGVVPKVNIDIGKEVRIARYVRSNTEGDELTFAYTVREGDFAPDGVSLRASQISITGGRIVNGGTRASLHHRNLLLQKEHKVDAVRPTAVGAGMIGNRRIIVQFQEDMAGKRLDGFLVAGLDASNPTREIIPRSRRVDGDRSVEIWLNEAAHADQPLKVRMRAGSIEDGAGNENVSELIDVESELERPPHAIKRVWISSDPGSDNNYTSQDILQVSVEFGRIMQVSRKPRLRVLLGPARGFLAPGQERWLQYVRGAGTQTLVFERRFFSSDESIGSGIMLPADGIYLAGGWIRDGEGTDADLRYATVGPDPRHRSNFRPPYLTNARTNEEGTVIRLEYNEAVVGNEDGLAESYTVLVDGEEVELVEDNGIEKKEVNIIWVRLTRAITSGQAIRMRYRAETARLRDVAGNLLADADFDVQNRRATTVDNQLMLSSLAVYEGTGLAPFNSLFQSDNVGPHTARVANGWITIVAQTADEDAVWEVRKPTGEEIADTDEHTPGYQVNANATGKTTVHVRVTKSGLTQQSDYIVELDRRDTWIKAEIETGISDWENRQMRFPVKFSHRLPIGASAQVWFRSVGNATATGSDPQGGTVEGADYISVINGWRIIDRVDLDADKRANLAAYLTDAAGDDETVPMQLTEVVMTERNGRKSRLTITGHQASGTIDIPTDDEDDDTSRQEEADPLTVELKDLPNSHDGSNAFTLEVAFSEDVDLDADSVPGVLTVNGASSVSARALEDGSTARWELSITPSVARAVTILIGPTLSCEAETAICTEDGRKLEAGAGVMVPYVEPATPQVSATFSGLPANHGGNAFSFDVSFSEAFRIRHETMRDQVFNVQGGRVSAARRTDNPHNEDQELQSNRVWQITVTPQANAGDVVIGLETGGTLDTSGGIRLAQAVSATMPRLDPARTVTPLTARFVNMPTEHDGASEFTFEVHYSEAVKLRWSTMSSSVLTVTNGELVGARRIDNPHHDATTLEANRSWEMTVRPDGNANVTVTLPRTTDCNATGAVCAEDGRMLSEAVTSRIAGPPSLSVADAKVTEEANAKLKFVVTLSRVSVHTISVDWATSDGTATDGADYTGDSGTLTFNPGDTTRNIEIEVLEDGIDEGTETMTLTLSNASGGNVWLADDTATGQIENDDPMPQAWLSRFGRTVGSQAVEAIGDRLKGPGRTRIVIGGQQVGLRLGNRWLEQADRRAITAGDDALNPRHTTMNERELLTRSAFEVSSGGERGAGTMSAWGRFARDGFNALDDEVRLDGKVTTGFLGADVEYGKWLAGAAVGISRGDGGYRHLKASSSGRVESDLTAVYPYARLRLGRKTDVWGLAGYGTGEIKLTHRHPGDEEERYRTDIGMKMGAVGAKGQILAPKDSGGFSLAVRSDAMWVRTDSDAVTGSEGNLAASESDVTRVRVVLQGAREMEMGAGILTPGLELGVRHDGGDSETGAGLEVGGSIRYAAGRFALEGLARTLVAHEESGYEEWGVAGSVRLEPKGSGRGLSFSVNPTWGTPASGTDRLWGHADARGLAPRSEFDARQHLEARIGYGLGLGDGPGVMTPYMRLGLGEDDASTLGLGTRWKIAPAVTLGLEARRRSQAETVDREVTFSAQARW